MLREDCTDVDQHPQLMILADLSKEIKAVEAYELDCVVVVDFEQITNLASCRNGNQHLHHHHHHPSSQPSPMPKASPYPSASTLSSLS